MVNGKWWSSFILACVMVSLACADAPDLVNNASGGEVLVEIDLATHETHVAPDDLDQLLENGGDGPVRLLVRDASGEVVADVRGKNIEGAKAMLAQQAKYVAERMLANRVKAIESMSLEDLDEMMDMVTSKPLSSWTTEDVAELNAFLKEKAR